MAVVIWEPEALDHIASIRSYVRQFDGAGADRLVQRLSLAGNSLDRLSNRGRPCADGTRELVTVLPYVIRYIVSDERVRILAVRHTRRQSVGR